MDDKAWLSWDNLELKRLMKAQYNTLTLTDTALDKCLTTLAANENEMLHSDVTIAAYRNDYGALNEKYDKKKRQSQRKTWLIVGSGVLGMMLGVYIAK